MPHRSNVLKAASVINKVKHKMKCYGNGNHYVHQDFIAFLLRMSETNPNMSGLMARNEIDKTRIGPNARAANTNVTKEYNFDIAVKYKGTNTLHTIIEVEADRHSRKMRLKLEDCVANIPSLRAVIVFIKNATGEIEYYQVIRDDNGEFKRVRIDELFGIKTTDLTDNFIDYLRATGKILDYNVVWKTV